MTATRTESTTKSLFENAAVRLEADGIHWQGTFTRIVYAALADLTGEAETDVVIRRTFGADDREVYVSFTATGLDRETVRGRNTHDGDDIAIAIDSITGLAF